MSGLASDVVREAHDLLHDSNYANPVVPDDLLRQSINRNATILSAELGIGAFWITSAITTDPTLYDYDLPKTIDGNEVRYEQVINLVYNRDRWPLVKFSRDECLISRAGSQRSVGRQFSYALSQNPDQSLTVNFPGKPSQVETIDAYVTIVPSQWDAGEDAPTLLYSQRALRALALMVADDVGRPLSDDKLVALQLSPKSFDGFHAQAQELLRLERLTIIRLKRSNGPKNFAWFASWWR